MSDIYDYEEEFHKGERREIRKDRRIAQAKDRSKYKKSNQKKEVVVKAANSDLLTGQIIAISGEGILVYSKAITYACSLRGQLKKDVSRKKNLIAVGDIVELLPLSKKEGQIINVRPRTSILERADISGRRRQLIATNIDTVFITTSIGAPPLKPFLIDRYVIAAQKGNMQPVVVINKIDLLEEFPLEKKLLQEFLKAYSDLDILLISCKTREGIDALKNRMQNHCSVFSGQSGVGKSSLINEVMDTNLTIGEVMLKGRHTTTKAQLLPVGNHGFCIDTPGIRRFGFWQLSKKDVITRFQQLQLIGSNCKYPNCRHIKEPHCAVKTALAEGKVSTMIYKSYQKLLEEAEKNTASF